MYKMAIQVLVKVFYVVHDFSCCEGVCQRWVVATIIPLNVWSFPRSDAHVSELSVSITFGCYCSNDLDEVDVAYDWDPETTCCEI